MDIEYDKLAIPQDLKAFVMEFTSATRGADIPPGWDGIIIYHPATNQYYSSKTINPWEYSDMLRSRSPQSLWATVAVALREMLDTHRQFQMFILNRKARGVVETWLAEIGKKRVATKMGQAANGVHVMFKVYSPFNKFTRYVTAPGDTPNEKLIEQANRSIKIWLGSAANKNSNERQTIRVALRYFTSSSTEAFEDKSVVSRTNLLNGYKHNEFRIVTQRQNLTAIREFVSNTTGG
jgi:hypothetical protein